MPSHFIAFTLPAPIESQIKNAYHQVFDGEITIDQLHLTLIPPFSLNSTSSLSQIQQILDQLHPILHAFTFSKPAIFDSHQTNLHLPVIPKPPLDQLYHQLKSSLKPHITINTHQYPHHTLPNFSPHVSLDYDFTHSHGLLPQLHHHTKNMKFKLSSPRLINSPQ